jgi:poly(ADP-ribose) glycohydrolase ARH3
VPTNDYPRCRFRGALLGAAIGDGIGAPFEGNWIVNTDRLQQIADSAAPLRYTDDTHMTIGLAEAILERGGFDGAQTAAVFARNYAREPWRGYGAGPPRIFQLMERGVRWDQAAGSLYGGIGSFGNGAAMRVAPVALFARGDLERVADLARQSAAVTHTHAEGVDGAVLQACAIALLTLQPPGAKLDRSRLLTGLAPYLRTRTFRAIIEQLEELPAGMPPADAARLLGNGIEASRSVPLALYAFLENFGAFPDCVLYAVSAGGDTDTIASMAGALSGAYGVDPHFETVS